MVYAIIVYIVHACAYIYLVILKSIQMFQPSQVMKHLTSVNLTSCENSPQSIFMKTSGHPVDLTFERASSRSPIDKTKAIVVIIVNVYNY